MAAVVDALWAAMSAKGVSWVGVYVKSELAPEMLLGPRQNKPACSPIGLHGACGRAWKSARPLIVEDVARLGEGYIACDPRDRSEVVMPLVDAETGVCWGVLDVDSYDLAAFGPRDVAGLGMVLEHMQLTTSLRHGLIETV